MTTKPLIDDAFIFVLVISTILAALMVFTTITNYQALGFTGLWYEIDLRIEGNIATWMQSLCILCCIIPLHALVHRSKNFQFRTHLFFLISIPAAMFLSADEMLGLHEQIGEKVSATSGLGQGSFMEGFPWVLVYIPLMLVAIAWVVLTALDLAKKLEKPSQKSIHAMLVLTGLAIISILALEAGEAWIRNSFDRAAPLLTLVEESAELVVITSFYRALQLLNRYLA